MFTRRPFGLSGLGARLAEWVRSHATPPSRRAVFEISRTEVEWKARLTGEQYYVMRQHGTERACSSPLHRNDRDGTYACAACGLPLFASKAKFASDTGWPSFYAPIDGSVATSWDLQILMPRTEVHCRRCGGHLGHIFKDGPEPTGRRYCVNGTSLKFCPA